MESATQLNEKQKLAFDKIVQGENCFISGPGGVGKSFLTRKIKDNFPDSTVFLAPTGIAALNIGGTTIHSTFKFPFQILTKKHHRDINKKTEDIFKKDGPVNRIVIDEIPMVRLDIFKAIDEQLKRIRRDKRPFGGLQVILVGDFFQLPPVITNNERSYYFDHYDSAYCFGDETWSSAGFEYVELDEIIRQKDEDFIDNLQTIRQKKDGYKHSVDFFNRIGMNNQKSVLDEDPTFLCTTRRTTNSINDENYQELDGKEHVYYAEKTQGFKGAPPAPETLKLKFGTKVILTANTEVHKNGEIGYVVDFLGEDTVVVLIEDRNEEILVKRFRWEDREYMLDSKGALTTQTIGSFTQFPLNYGWAVTIHKCQGLTLTNGMIHMGRGAFTSGQTYVALSRMKSLEGLGLFDEIDYDDIMVDDEIKEFYDNDCKGIGLL